MKSKILTCLAFLFLIGCGNLSPRDNLNPKLDVQNQGRIDKIEQNQQLLRSEVDKISLINRENNNSGVQILQGEGGLLLVFGVTVVVAILYYFYKVAESERKTSEILAQQIVRRDDFDLEDDVMKAAENTEVEKKIYSLMRNERVKFSMKKETQ